MKGLFLYLMICLVVFIGITNGIVYLSERYENVFTLDFSPKKSLLIYNPTLSADSLALLKKGLVEEDVFKEWMRNPAAEAAKKDSIANAELAAKDSVKADPSSPNNNTQTVDSKGVTAQSDSTSDRTPTTFNPKDKKYIAWREKTIQLYETMDPKKVAQVIQSFSDNIARDLIYSMKKKKAAKILSFMEPDVVVRLTKAQ